MNKERFSIRKTSRGAVSACIAVLGLFALSLSGQDVQANSQSDVSFTVESNVTEVDIANAESAVVTAESAVKSAELALESASVVTEEDVIEAESVVAEINRTPVTEQVDTDALQKEVDTANSNYEEAVMAATDATLEVSEASKELEEAQKGEQVTKSATETIVAEPTTEYHEEHYGKSYSPTQLEPIYADGGKTHNMGEVDANFNVDNHVAEFRTEVINYVNQAREVNGLTAGQKANVTAEEQAIANSIAEQRVAETLAEYKQNGSWTHNTSLDYSAQGYYFTEVIAYMGGETAYSAKEQAFKTVQLLLTDVTNVFNNLGHSATLLGYSDVTYGVHTQEGMTVIALVAKAQPGANKGAVLSKHDDFYTITNDDGTVKDSFVSAPNLSPSKLLADRREFAKAHPELFNQIYGTVQPVQVGTRVVNGYPKNYNGSNDMAIYVVTPSTGSIVRAKYLPKETFVYTVTKPATTVTVVDYAKVAKAQSRLAVAASVAKAKADELEKAKNALTSAQEALRSAILGNSVPGYANAEAKATALESATSVVENLRQQLSNLGQLRANVEEAKSNLSAAQTRLATLRAKYEAQGVSTGEVVVTLKEEVKTSKEEVVTPKEEVETPKEEVETPKEEVETPKEDVETPKEDVETPKEEVETTKEEVETPKEDVEAPKEEVETPKEEVETPKEEVETPKEDVETKPEVKPEVPSKPDVTVVVKPITGGTTIEVVTPDKETEVKEEVAPAEKGARTESETPVTEEIKVAKDVPIVAEVSQSSQESVTYSHYQKNQANSTLPETGDLFSMMTVLGIGLSLLGLVGLKRSRS